MDENTARLWLKYYQNAAEKLVWQQVEAFQLQLDTLRAELQATRVLEDDLDRWILATTKYFSLLNTPADQRLRIVGFNLEGVAAEYEDPKFKIQEKAVEYVRSLYVALLEVVFTGPVDEVRTKFAEFFDDKGCVKKLPRATKLPEGGNSHSAYSSYRLEDKVIFKGTRNVTPWSKNGGRR
ncbi:hypothetical protein Tco_0763121 [Tanacetum coccineum]